MNDNRNPQEPPKAADARPESSDDGERKHFLSLGPFIEKVKTNKLERGKKFRLCLRASLVKCYEFNLLVRRPEDREFSFFWLSSLRGICEDLIILNFIKGIPNAERERLIGFLMTHDVCTRMISQRDFFSVARPQQTVLVFKDVESKLAEADTKVVAIWNAHGWPNLKKGPMPQIRQIAEKQGSSIVSRLYDYLYRLTSGTVHFSVQSLLRSGWGSIDGEMTFSPKNFHPYFSMFGRVYGSYLFCLYFEFFSRFFRLSQDEAHAVAEIRKSVLLEPRWPEMVTFEEMNVEPPKTHILGILYSVVQSQKTKRLMK